MSIIKPLITAIVLMISLTINAQTCNSNVKDDWQNNRYIDNGDGTILDKFTKLIWKQCAEGLSGDDCATGGAIAANWQQALQQANSSIFAGKLNWRLPNLKELLSLVRLNCISPAINEALFPSNPAKYFWSSSPFMKDSSQAWAVTFYKGYYSNINRNNSHRFRLVNAGDVINSIPTLSVPTALNDTGITWGGSYPSGNNAGCTGTTITAQDCSHGRDAKAAANTLTKIGAGSAGFDFTKLDSNGNTLSASATDWRCVKDNHTGLVWEVKTTSNLHNKNDTYNWYNTNSATNGGAVGFADDDGNTCHGYNSSDSNTFCNTQAFVNRVNTAGLCGANDWRMPDRNELRSIVNYGRLRPSIDTGYFPNTPADDFWSSSPHSSYSPFAWTVLFNSGGYVSYDARNLSNRLRLVRSGQ
ncbi:MAG: DUF1566 domain-containing protein [Gammaproteobacteria bacterium]|nr:DUF1566 domain-containing protein [Gammaproteobacteria bacterium]